VIKSFKAGLNVQTINDISGLTIEEVNNIVNNINKKKGL